MNTKINKVTKYAILWLHSQNHSIDDISKELKISDTTKIQKLISATVDQKDKVFQPESKISTTSEPVRQKSVFKDMMINNSASGKTKVAAMTKDASGLTDKPTQPISKINPAIFRINDE